jgi:hypothetical protein
LARNGEREAARQLLAQLQDMLENLRMAQPGQGAQQGINQAQQMMRGMREMMQRQQQLLDRSFRAQQQAEQGDAGTPGQPGGQQPGGQQQGAGIGDAANQQESLRRALGEMMRRMGDGLGDIPDPLGRAERAMKDATEALRRASPGEAIGPQTDALDQLQQAARELAQQMQQRLGNALDQGEGRDNGNGFGERRDSQALDPLGRPLPGSEYDQGDVKIPDNNTLQRVRDILDELRRRAGERDRPQLELDYIDRLLQRF